MTNQNTGGPAFPTENAQQTGSSSYRYEGMMLRDYFAAKAMQGDLHFVGLEGNDCAMTAAMAYEMADAMLEARK